MAKKPVNEVIENVRNAARMFQSVIDLADSLEAVASVEQAARAAELRAVNARKEAEAAEERCARAQAEAEGFTAGAKKTLADVQEHCNERIAAAKAEADRRLEDASRRIDQMRADADAKRTDIFSECQEMEARRNLMGAELGVLQGKIDAAKAQIAKMLGGEA